MNPKFVLICLVVFIIGFPIGVQFTNQSDTKQSLIPNLQAYGLPTDPVKSPVPVVKEEWFLTNVSQIIKIQTPQDIEKKRKELINYIWKGDFPKGKPPLIRKNVELGQYKEFVGVKSLDTYEFEWESLKTKVYHFKTRAKSPKPYLIILHIGNKPLSQSFHLFFTFFSLRVGFDVLVIPSPLSSIEDQNLTYSSVPAINTPSFGYLGLTDQNVFFLLEENTFSPLQLYFDPLALSLNLIDQQYNYTSYHLIGSFDGAWEATVYSAIDPRIKTSYAIYPPLPFFVATNSDSTSLRNYEYFHPKFTKITNYPELYVMASHGKGRKHIQLIDTSNPHRYNEEGYKAYADEVARRVETLDAGDFETRVFDTKQQKESLVLVLKQIYSDIEGKEIKVDW